MRTLTAYEIDAALSSPHELSMWLQEHISSALVGVASTGPKSPLTYWLRSYGAMEACVWSDVVEIDGRQRQMPRWAVEFIRAMDAHGYGPITAHEARMLLPRATRPEPMSAPGWQVMARGRPFVVPPLKPLRASRDWQALGWSLAGWLALSFVAYLAWHAARWGMRGWV